MGCWRAVLPAFFSCLETVSSISAAQKLLALIRFFIVSVSLFRFFTCSYILYWQRAFVLYQNSAALEAVFGRLKSAARPTSRFFASLILRVVSVTRAVNILAVVFSGLKAQP
uniref:Uncharacterized protein n=1 Tax=Ixodes ricinus TaxID=34613 RepID=A0A6B0UJW3_IXORI